MPGQMVYKLRHDASLHQEVVRLLGTSTRQQLATQLHHLAVKQIAVPQKSGKKR